MNNTSLRKLDQIVIQTEHGPKLIHVSDITALSEEPWLDRFGAWGSLRINNGPPIYFSSPSCSDIIRKRKEIAALADRMVRRYQMRQNFRKSTSGKDNKPLILVTRNA